MKRILLITVCVICCCTAAAGALSERLVGKWRSNRELSVATFANVPAMSAKRRAFIEGMFGKLEITYEVLRYSSRLPDGSSDAVWENYRVLKEEGDVVWIELSGTPKEETRTVRVTFEGPDRYWIVLGEKYGTREYFDRVLDEGGPNPRMDGAPAMSSPSDPGQVPAVPQP